MGFITANPGFSEESGATLVPPVTYERAGYTVLHRRASFQELIVIRSEQAIVGLLIAAAIAVVMVLLIPFAFFFVAVAIPLGILTLFFSILARGRLIAEAECPSCHLVTQVGRSGAVGLCRHCFNRYVHHQDGHIRSLA